MKFFIDQDVSQTTVDYLKSLGYNVLKASEVGLQREPDEELLRYAYEHQRILVTRDKGYGALVFLSFQEHSGVILLRVQPQTTDAVHQELKRFLQEQAQEHLQDYFIVIEPGGHRIRKSEPENQAV